MDISTEYYFILTTMGILSTFAVVTSRENINDASSNYCERIQIEECYDSGYD